jgi:hypothetical protein
MVHQNSWVRLFPWRHLSKLHSLVTPW